MRIGIEASRADPFGKRGMERYVNGLIRALGKVDRENEYILFTEDGLLPARLSLGKNFKTEHPRRRFRMIFRKGVGFIGRLFFRDIDIFHFPNSYAWYSKYAKTLVTLQDIAPFHFPEVFFNSDAAFAKCKQDMLYLKKNAERIITTSEFSKSDIVKRLDIPPEKIDVIYSGIDSKFKPITVTQDQINALKQKFNVDTPYVFFVGGFDFRKDALTLLRAFDAAVKEGGFGHKLVIAGSALEDSRLRLPLEEVLNSLTIKERVIFTGPLGDDDLLVLYNCADLFVFPSIFEGFGFPVLEAMACGCPTASSNAASLPEVAGNAAMLFNPGDVQGLKEIIAAVLKVKDLRQGLREKGLKQADKFSWENTAKATISVYRELLKNRYSFG